MKLGLIAAAAMVLAPVAHAQQTGCPLIKSIVAGASGGFNDLRGEEIDEDWYDSKVWLADAEECGIELSDGAEFYCTWGFPNPAAASSKTVFLSEAVKLCLPDWKVEDIAGRKSFNNLTINKGVAMTGSGPATDTVLEVFAETYENSQETMAWISVRQR